MLRLAQDILSIPSPTFQEQDIVLYFKAWVARHLSLYDVLEFTDSLIITPKKRSESLPHVLLVGHSDVVPEWFEPFVSEGKLFGSGASDMKVSVACYLELLKTFETLGALSLVIYAREENTPLEKNGLYDLLVQFPEFFRTVELAIVGEPTNLTLQLGCVGSLHATVRILGERAHSARPWEGKNALYEALPFIDHVRRFERQAHEVFGVTFYDVIQITESASEPGPTTVPGYWTCNINFRYAPVYTASEAEAFLKSFLDEANVPYSFEVKSNVYAGRVLESPLFSKTVTELALPIEAKQAWTDVAQLTEAGIPAFNFGPGLTSQAHKANEYIVVADVETYFTHLKHWIEGVFL